MTYTRKDIDDAAIDKLPDVVYVHTDFGRTQGAKLWDRRYWPRIRAFFNREKSITLRLLFMKKQRRLFYRCLLGRNWEIRVALQLRLTPSQQRTASLRQ
jgi:hypothetical protein